MRRGHNDTVLEVRTTLTDVDIQGFLHVVATIQLGGGNAGRIVLYVNGQLRDEARATGGALTRWADADASGLGDVAKQLGGNGGDLQGFGPFAGLIAQVRMYDAALNTADVLGEFLAVAASGALLWDSGENVTYVDFASGQPAPDAESFILTSLGGGLAGWDQAPDDTSLYGIVELEALWRLAGIDHEGLTVSVRDVRPQVALSGPAQLDEGSLFTLTIEAPTDPARIR